MEESAVNLCRSVSIGAPSVADCSSNSLPNANRPFRRPVGSRKREEGGGREDRRQKTGDRSWVQGSGGSGRWAVRSIRFVRRWAFSVERSAFKMEWTQTGGQSFPRRLSGEDGTISSEEGAVPPGGPAFPPRGPPFPPRRERFPPRSEPFSREGSDSLRGGSESLRGGSRSLPGGNRSPRGVDHSPLGGRDSPSPVRELDRRLRPLIGITMGSASS